MSANVAGRSRGLLCNTACKTRHKGYVLKNAGVRWRRIMYTLTELINWLTEWLTNMTVQSFNSQQKTKRKHTWLKASAVVVILCKIFWVFTRRRFVLVRNQRFGTTSLSHLQGLQNPLLIHLETLKIGQISSPETLVPYQKKNDAG